ncbi:hypothetical protein HMPREF3213_03060 [Heyndrickxia coagulans]|uniref:Uncharacterized protein n=1 Tax=Heyndrickxia coagulans TaxID=1398 RepID=A0A133KFC3_HEYCO|nr:hypothetical protein HMPREF3213_03060 [Heyndrickxia coagulans]
MIVLHAKVVWGGQVKCRIPFQTFLCEKYKKYSTKILTVI